MPRHRKNLRWIVETLKGAPTARQLRLLAGCLVTILIAASLATTAEAQSKPAGVGVIGAGKRVPFVLQTEPPTLTPEQQQLRDAAMRRANRPGPPLPEA